MIQPMRSPVSPWLLALALLACSAQESAPSLPSAPVIRSDDPVARALGRAAFYLGRKPVRGDQIWLLTQAARLLGGEFPDWAGSLPTVSAAAEHSNLEGRLARLRDLAPRPLMPLPVPQHPPVTRRVELSDDDLARFLRVMELSFSCSEHDRGRRGELLADLREPGTSYLLTHQLWAAVTAYHLGCIEAAELDPLREKLGLRVLAELLADERITDLSVERMAMLCYAGLVGWIPADQRAMLLRDQVPWGSWGEVPVAAHANLLGPEGHTAALGFYVLAHLWAPRG
jgi:hypothetical protein